MSYLSDVIEAFNAVVVEPKLSQVYQMRYLLKRENGENGGEGERGEGGGHRR